jgi:hypothetical protein
MSTDSFLPIRFGDMEEAFSNEYIMEALGLVPPSPPNSQEVLAGDFPEEIGEIIAKLTKEEAARLIAYIRTKS